MEPSPPPSSQATWAKAVTIIAVALILAWTVREVARRSAEAVKTVANAFRSGNVTNLFLSYATTVEPTSRLQFATLKEMEVFERRDSRIVLGIPLPEVVVEARVPVECTYYVDLKGKWEFHPGPSGLSTGDPRVVEVIAPPIQFNKPALDVSRLEYREVKSSVWRREGRVIEELKASLTGFSIQRAKENIPQVREQGRGQIADFVRKWLSREFSDGAGHRIVVHFSDEPIPAD